MQPRARWVLLGLSVGAACAACREATEHAASRSSRGTESLRAMGYAGWDEGADEGRSGVTLHDERRAADGVNLYTNDVNELYAMGMD